MMRRTEPGAREIGLMVIGAILLALAMHWPLPLHIGSDVPRDLGDPMGQAWQLAWIGDALVHDPGSFFQANIWWPLHNTLATTDMLLGYAPAAMIGSGPEAALVRYDLLFLFAYALAFIGAYLLARELGVGPAGAAVAGAAYAYAPWRLAHDNHLNILSSGGIPLAIFLLLRGYRRNSPVAVLAGWLVVAWQLLLGLGLGLQLAYLVLVLALFAVVYWLRRRPPLRRGVVGATAGGIGLLLLVTGFLARSYLVVRDDYPEAERTPALVWALSPDTRSFFRAPPGNLLWGARAQGFHGTPQEFDLYPGAVIALLAIAGILAPVYPKRRRLALAIAVAGLAWLSLGWRFDRSYPLQPYKLVYEYLPGWDAIRVPSRINTLTSLGLALLAAAGAQHLVDLSRRQAASRSPRAGVVVRLAVVPGAVSIALVAAILLEGSGFQFRDGGLQAPEHPHVPAVPPGQVGAPEPQLHLPSLYLSRHDVGASSTLYTFWSTEGFPETVNGWGGFVPNQELELYSETHHFPDLASVARLRERGIRTVILHADRAAQTQWEDAAARPVKGLPLRREVRGELVLYYLKPLRRAGP